jgi:putative ATPase
MRPRTLDEFVGQEHFLGPGKLLRRLLQADRLGSVIFYGPPGTGKTALAHVIAQHTRCRFAQLNAVSSGTKEVRAVLEEARAELEETGRRTILFVDELHRFNRAQQDVLLPDVEEGRVILIGATTQNPFFAVNSPLVRRRKIFTSRPEVRIARRFTACPSPAASPGARSPRAGDRPRRTPALAPASPGGSGRTD